MKGYNIGWAKQVCEKLELWGLNQSWEEIRVKTPGQWKSEVKRAAEKINVEKLKEECETKNRGESKEKTKTKFVIERLNNIDYSRRPDSFILTNPSLTYTRAIIMGRFGMLKCANNYSNGHGTKMCNVCNVIDDEDHRINDCKKWQTINMSSNSQRVPFTDIYHDEYDRCLNVVKVILSMWDLENGKNEMKAMAC